MCKLTRGERFKDARTVYNQHGTQSMNDVYEATGVSASLIKDLEDDEKERSVGYDKVTLLAKHYGVSADFLLGLTEDYHVRASAVDELGISPWAVEQIELFVKDDAEGRNVFNSILGDESFWEFFHELCSFFYAKRAEYMYHTLLGQGSPCECGKARNPHSQEAGFNQKLKNTIENTWLQVPDEIAIYLKAIPEFQDSELGRNIISGLPGPSISEFPELRARKAFDDIMYTLDRYAERAGEPENIPECLVEAMR